MDIHELSLTQNLLDIALEHAGIKPIQYVNLSVGEFSDEHEEAIRLHWDDLPETLPHLRRVEAEMRCLSGEAVLHPEQKNSLCPSYGCHRLQRLSSDAMQLESSDV